LREHDGQEKIIRIAFDYLEPLAGMLRQAFLSAVMERRQGGNRSVGEDFISVPRGDVDQPVSVGVDIMTGNIIPMLLLGSPFQSCYSMPIEIARTLAHDILAACETAVSDPDLSSRKRPN